MSGGFVWPVFAISVRAFRGVLRIQRPHAAQGTPAHQAPGAPARSERAPAPRTSGTSVRSHAAPAGGGQLPRAPLRGIVPGVRYARRYVWPYTAELSSLSLAEPPA